MDPFLIFPEVVWDCIIGWMEKIDTTSLENIFIAYPMLRINLYHSRKSLLLMKKVLPFLAKAEDITSDDILGLRGICKLWMRDVERFLVNQPQLVSINPSSICSAMEKDYRLHAISNEPHGVAGLGFGCQHFTYLFADHDISFMYIPMIEMLDDSFQGNPFLSKSVCITIWDMNEDYDRPHPKVTIQRFLRLVQNVFVKFQDHIQCIQIDGQVGHRYALIWNWLRDTLVQLNSVRKLNIFLRHITTSADSDQVADFGHHNVHGLVVPEIGIAFKDNINYLRKYFPTWFDTKTGAILPSIRRLQTDGNCLDIMAKVGNGNAYINLTELKLTVQNQSDIAIFHAFLDKATLPSLAYLNMEREATLRKFWFCENPTPEPQLYLLSMLYRWKINFPRLCYMDVGEAYCAHNISPVSDTGLINTLTPALSTSELFIKHPVKYLSIYEFHQKEAETGIDFATLLPLLAPRLEILKVYLSHRIFQKLDGPRNAVGETTFPEFKTQIKEYLSARRLLTCSLITKMKCLKAIYVNFVQVHSLDGTVPESFHVPLVFRFNSHITEHGHTFV